MPGGRHSEKRGGQVVKLSLVEFDVGELGPDSRLLALNEALDTPEAVDPRAAQVVDLPFFGGLGETDAAEVLGISVATLKRDWDFAKTWLAAQLA
jgi:DNA-directed RNA polymerase specialized sigma24 family protein